jgi:tetratricopeptide (TPR) repeat protein
MLALAAVSLLWPREAAAQSAPVFRALADLRATLDGTFGDEGVELPRRLADLTAAAADRSGRDAAPELSAPAPDDPVATYLALANARIDEADRARAIDRLVRAAQDSIAGALPRTRSKFSQPEAVAIAAGGAPRFPLARYAGGFAVALQGQLDEAVERLRKASEGDPLIADPAVRSEGMRQAAAALRHGRLRDAIGALERAVAASPGSSEAHRMLGTAAALAGDTRRGVAQLEAALRIRPDDERSWIALAGVHVEAGATVEAVRTFEKAIAAIPDSGRLRWDFAGLLVKENRHADALEHYSAAEQLSPLSGRAQAHLSVATLASLSQDVPRATAAADRRVRGNLNDAQAHRDLAGLYTKAGREDQAFAELAIAAWLDPGDQATFVALGQSLMARGRDEDAVAAFERAVALQPDLREARYGLAQALMRVGRRDDARQHLAEFERQRAEAIARERRAFDVDALKEEAARRSAAGQHVQAAGIWRKLIAIEPGAAPYYFDLAESLFRAGALEESLLYFVKTADMDGVAEVHLRLAEVLARLGRAKESALARETYERLRLQDFRARSTQPPESKRD